MIVIVKDNNYITIYKYRHKLIRYYLCIIINKIKGYQVKVIDHGLN